MSTNEGQGSGRRSRLLKALQALGSSTRNLLKNKPTRQEKRAALSDPMFATNSRNLLESNVDGYAPLPSGVGPTSDVAILPNWVKYMGRSWSTVVIMALIVSSIMCIVDYSKAGSIHCPHNIDTASKNDRSEEMQEKMHGYSDSANKWWIGAMVTFITNLIVMYFYYRAQNRINFGVVVAVFLFVAIGLVVTVSGRVVYGNALDDKCYSLTPIDDGNAVKVDPSHSLYTAQTLTIVGAVLNVLATFSINIPAHSGERYWTR